MMAAVSTSRSQTTISRFGNAGISKSGASRSLEALHRTGNGALQDSLIASRGSFIQEPNQFPFGMAMNYPRTGDPSMLKTVNDLAANSIYGLSASSAAWAVSARMGTYMVAQALQR